MPPSVQEPLESSSEATDSSSSTPASTDSEPDTEDTARIVEPQVEVHLPAAAEEDGSMALFLINQSLEKEDGTNLSLRFGPHEPMDTDVESEADEESTLDFAARLDSLNFDQLAFDPESFASAVQT
jgi:hypothetical protein